MKDRSTGKSRGFGFVTFQLASDAAHAGNKEHVVDGRRCEVSTAASHHCPVLQHSPELRQRHWPTALHCFLWQGVDNSAAQLLFRQAPQLHTPSESAHHEIDRSLMLQAKYALPRGGGPAPRTTRIFVARIPPMVSDVEFRQYFERFGQVQVGSPCQQACITVGAHPAAGRSCAGVSNV